MIYKVGHRKDDDADTRARFDYKILSVTLARQMVAKRKGLPLPYIIRPIMSKLILKSLDDPSINDNLLMLVICEIAE